MYLNSKSPFGIIAFLLLLVSSTRVVDADSPDECRAKSPGGTQLDFLNSKLTENSLQYGGVMKFEEIANVGGRSVDLVVSVVPGTTYETPRGDLRNGKTKSGKFGQINLFTVKGDLDSGKGDFRFCLRDHETGELATADSFVWSVFDIDDRNRNSDGIKEKMAIDLARVDDYVLYPSESNSEIKSTCENSGLPPPCAGGERIVFNASTKGIGKDNPSDPNNLTEQQMKRAVVFSFSDTSCWDFTYHHYCRIEAEEGGICRWYGGGNFLFSGVAAEVVEDGECIPATPSCDNNPNPFEWKGKETSCDTIAALGAQKQSRKCREGRRITRECPAICRDDCATPSPTVTPTLPRGDCEDNPNSFEFKGRVTSCLEIAALGPQKKARKCASGRRIEEECPTVCKPACSS